MADQKIEDLPIVKSLLEHDLPAPSEQQKQLEQEWKGRASKMTSLNLKAIEPNLAELDAHLTLRSYIAGYTLSRADLWVWGALRSNRVATSYIKQGLMVNLSRWFNFIEETNSWIADAVLAASAAKLSVKENKEDDGASYDIGLQDTEKGVVTRFPPEPSGYLHIGHAKAALLNNYFAHEKYKGTLILRFDDTNPSKEKEEFQESIKEDLKLLGIKADKTSHTSDFFQELYDHCLQLIKDGNAFADDSTKDEMAYDRGERPGTAVRAPPQASKNREISIEDTLAKFEEMKAGTPEGTRWSIRAKMGYDHANSAMRDPVVYRCNPQPHHRTKDTWKVYPTYDFACPIVDSVEGVTHALRTTEYNERDEQYQWFITALKLRKVYNWNFSRLNMIRTLLSKRKLTKLVDEGVVTGWDDPRMPTVRGIRRHGMTIAALHEFILKQGPSKNVVLQDWSAFWATNKKHIDPTAARYTAIASTSSVPCTITGGPSTPVSEDKEKHAKYALGTKKVVYSSSILLEQTDAATLEQDEEITLMNWGNAFVRSLERSEDGSVKAATLELHLEGDVKKTKKKITWLSTDQELVPVELVEFDHLITKDKPGPDDEISDILNPKTEMRTEARADCNVAGLKVDDVIQFDRKGYYRVDKAYKDGEKAVFFEIPTGKN